MPFIPFQEAKDAFEKSLPDINLRLVTFIAQRVNALAQGLKTMDGNQLTEIETQLASSLRQLGILQAEAETKANFIDDQLDAKWKELIGQMKGEDPKTTIRLIEAEFDSTYINEKINLTFWRGLARSYENQMSAINSILLAITHRLKEIAQPKPVVGQPVTKVTPGASTTPPSGAEISFL